MLRLPNTSSNKLDRLTTANNYTVDKLLERTHVEHKSYKPANKYLTRLEMFFL